MGNVIKITESQLRRMVRQILGEGYTSYPTDEMMDKVHKKSVARKAFKKDQQKILAKEFVKAVEMENLSEDEIALDVINKFAKDIGNSFGLLESNSEAFEAALVNAGMDSDNAFDYAYEVYQVIESLTVDVPFDDGSSGNREWKD